MKQFILSFLFSCFYVALFGQTFTLSGKIVAAKDSSILEGATIMLFHLPDSGRFGGFSDKEGNFSFARLPAGRYTINVSYIGYQTLTQMTGLRQDRNIGKIALQEEGVQGAAVNIIDRVPPATMKGDTTQFNAKAFKVNPDASAEDLVGKIPTMSNQNGKMQAQGEDIKQVLVNGKPFFGNDPNAVLRNIPAEMIDKVQIFDRQSDQARLTGFDDGNTSKTLNLIMKPEFQNGIFGRVYAGGGTNNRYKLGGNINYFKKDRRVSIIEQSNNINEQNFSSDDLLGVMSSTATQGGGSGGMGGGRPPGGMGGGGGGGGRRDMGNPADNFLSAQQNGITESNAIGVNYIDKWGRKADVAGSYFFNFTNNNANTTTFRQYVLPSLTGQNYNETNAANNKNLNHRANFRIEWQLDSMKTIIFTPQISIQHNLSNTDLTGITNKESLRLNETQNFNNKDLLGINFSNTLLYRQKLKKKGRTYSVSISNSYNNSKGYNHLNSYSAYYDTPVYLDSLSQRADIAQNGWSASGNLTYTEPINDKSFIQANYTASYAPSASDKQTRNSADNILDTTLSNVFNNQYYTQAAGASYRYQTMKTNFNVGADYQWSLLDNAQIYPREYMLNKSFHNVLPNAMLRMRISKDKNLRVFYRTSTNAPSVSQLQEVINNSNPIRLSIGNADLKQAYTHNLVTRYSSANPEKGTSFFVFLMGSLTQNYIGNSTFIAQKDTVWKGIVLKNGTQITQNTNLNGSMNLRSLFTYAFTIKPIKSNISVNVSANYTRTPGLINGQNNISQSPSTSLGVAITSNISPKLDFNVSSTSSLNLVRNTLQTALNSIYMNQSSRFKINYMPWKGLVLQTELNHQYYAGLSQSFNQNYLLWNAAIGYKFLKEKKADIRLVAFDILKQNNFIQRSTSETYVEDMRVAALQQYFMLVFTYNFKKAYGVKK